MPPRRRAQRVPAKKSTRKSSAQLPPPSPESTTVAGGNVDGDALLEAVTPNSVVPVESTEPAATPKTTLEIADVVSPNSVSVKSCDESRREVLVKEEKGTVIGEAVAKRSDGDENPRVCDSGDGDADGKKQAVVVDKVGKRVVKRVRIVKKVIKKKVPKKVKTTLGACSTSTQSKDEGNSSDVSTEVENPNLNISSEKENRNETDTNMSEVSVGEKKCESNAVRDNKDVSERPTSHIKESDENAENMALVADENAGCMNEVAEIGSQEHEVGGGNTGVNDETKNDGVGDDMSDGVITMSEEMEALERRKRRRTEIFIGGLDKNAKEEDVRKVFEEVGEILEVRLVMNNQTGKNKGYAFVRFALAADAKKALETYSKLEICGKQCTATYVEGNDTIFLGNLDKKWKTEDINKLLLEIGIEKIEKVTVMADPNNSERNRGFAFVELETIKDAQTAFKKLQKKDAFGKQHNIKVAWAEPLKEPDEEEMLKVKTVYAEFIPSSWDEEKVKDHFKKFGEIENVVLARNLQASRRKDFAFVRYTTREAALACIESLNREAVIDDGSKVNIKASLAKPLLKGKQSKQTVEVVSKESAKGKPKVAKGAAQISYPRNKVTPAQVPYMPGGSDRSSTDDELVKLLREQASWGQPQLGYGVGSSSHEYSHSLPGRKRLLSALGDDSLYSDPRGYPRSRLESSYAISSSSYSALPQPAGMSSRLYYQQQSSGYSSGSYYGFEDPTANIQTREAAGYLGNSGLYRRWLQMNIKQLASLIIQSLWCRSWSRSRPMFPGGRIDPYGELLVEAGTMLWHPAYVPLSSRDVQGYDVISTCECFAVRRHSAGLKAGTVHSKYVVVSGL
ncbi:RNA recognition motif domain, partial [Dillenia turbinata]